MRMGRLNGFFSQLVKGSKKQSKPCVASAYMALIAIKNIACGFQGRDRIKIVIRE